MSNFKWKDYLNFRQSIKAQILMMASIPMLAAIVVFGGVMLWSSGQSEQKIKLYESELMARKKGEIKNYVDMAIKAIEGRTSSEAKEMIKSMRFGESGYIWISDMGQPYPKMVMHPAEPSLDGAVMDSPKYNRAIGKNQNIFQAFVDACKTGGEGYVEYMWPKPAKAGLTEDKPKVSFVKLYAPFGWVIGTDAYIDDIQILVSAERARVKNEIASISIKVSVLFILLSILVIFMSVKLTDMYVGRQVDEIIMRLTGNDREQIPVITENEIGRIATFINQSRERLGHTLLDLSSTIKSLNVSIAEISSALSAQAAISSQQSAAIAEITSTVEELSSSSSQIADHSKSVVQIASDTWHNTTKGAESIETVISQIADIRHDTETSINEIIELGRRSKEITSIMEIINTIADQTKLIAFNAALEASSAGEYGKRFGVVAVEIRRLADSVMESTEEIEGKISEIQEAINRLVISSEKSAKVVEEGMRHSGETADVLVDVVSAAQATTDAAKQISLSTQQQKTASNQVVMALRDIVSGATQTSNAIARIDVISRELMQKASMLEQSVEELKA